MVVFTLPTGGQSHFFLKMEHDETSTIIMQNKARNKTLPRKIRFIRIQK